MLLNLAYNLTTCEDILVILMRMQLFLYQYYSYFTIGVLLVACIGYFCCVLYDDLTYFIFNQHCRWNREPAHLDVMNESELSKILYYLFLCSMCDYFNIILIQQWCAEGTPDNVWNRKEGLGLQMGHKRNTLQNRK